MPAKKVKPFDEIHWHCACRLSDFLVFSFPKVTTIEQETKPHRYLFPALTYPKSSIEKFGESRAEPVAKASRTRSNRVFNTLRHVSELHEITEIAA